MQWQNIVVVIMGTGLVAFVYSIYVKYLETKKKIIDLEYKNEKNEIKEIVKNDSIDTILIRIRNRFK